MSAEYDRPLFWTVIDRKVPRGMIADYSHKPEPDMTIVDSNLTVIEVKDRIPTHRNIVIYQSWDTSL